ncbi:type II secretion system protein [methanogenic archaeon mixed culture ISO4-G1]|nr:type II secretion system protein [methanogenic archaeon mixed culture ISO4-G1]
MMAAVLESGGSIDSAIRAVSRKGPSNSRELFTQAVRISDTKGSSSLSSALRGLLDALPCETEGYSQSLCMALCAADSPDEATMSALLSDAADASLESVRILGESYGNSLTVPCMTVFGLGIMAPMILVSILPLMGIGGMFGNALD